MGELLVTRGRRAENVMGMGMLLWMAMAHLPAMIVAVFLFAWQVRDRCQGFAAPIIIGQQTISAVAVVAFVVAVFVVQIMLHHQRHSILGKDLLTSIFLTGRLKRGRIDVLLLLLRLREMTHFLDDGSRTRDLHVDLEYFPHKFSRASYRDHSIQVSADSYERMRRLITVRVRL